MTGTPELIARLVADAGPVKRLRPPVQRAAAWLAGAVAVMLALGWWHGARPDLAALAGRPWFAAGLVAAALTGVLGAAAAFMLSQPDRPRAWALLPLPAALAWLATVSVGCLTDWVRLDPAGFSWGEAATCFGILLAASVPMSALLFWMLRRGGLLRPGAAVLCGGLAVAALSSCALSLVHAFEASAMILLWNFGAAGLVLAADWALGRRVVTAA